jgi:hypothetical protein
MAFTFLAAQGVQVGRTQIEKDWLEVGVGVSSLVQSIQTIIPRTNQPPCYQALQTLSPLRLATYNVLYQMATNLNG